MPCDLPHVCVGKVIRGSQKTRCDARTAVFLSDQDRKEAAASGITDATVWKSTRRAHAINDARKLVYILRSTSSILDNDINRVCICIESSDRCPAQFHDSIERIDKAVCLVNQTVEITSDVCRNRFEFSAKLSTGRHPRSIRVRGLSYGFFINDNASIVSALGYRFKRSAPIAKRLYPALRQAKHLRGVRFILNAIEFSRQIASYRQKLVELNNLTVSVLILDVICIKHLRERIFVVVGVSHQLQNNMRRSAADYERLLPLCPAANCNYWNLSVEMLENAAFF